MTLLINNQRAVITADTAFDYIAKNPLFDNREDYTLEITLPLRDCLRNRRLFGLQETVPDTFPDEFPARLIEGAFRKTGVLKILSVDRDEIHAQFIEQSLTGTALQEWEERQLSDLNIYLTQAECEAMGTSLPYYDSRTKEVMDSETDAVQSGATRYLAYYHLYMGYIVQRVIRAMGYTADLSAIAGSYLFRHLLCVNPVRRVEYGTGYAYPLHESLPAWTVGKFFDSIETLLAVKTQIDADAGVVSLLPLDSIFLKDEQIQVTPSVKYEAETLDDEQMSYWRDAKVCYSDAGLYGDCQWFVDKMVREGGTYLFTDLEDLNLSLQRSRDADTPIEMRDDLPAYRIMQASSRWFLAAEGQTGNESYGIWRVETLNRLRDNGGEGEEKQIDFRPADIVCCDTADADNVSMPSVASPEPLPVFADGDLTLPYRLLKDEKKDTPVWDTMYIVLCHEQDGSRLLWTHDMVQARARMRQSDVFYYRLTDAGNVRRFCDGEWENDDPKADMEYTRRLMTIDTAWQETFPLITPPCPIPTLCLYDFPELRPTGLAEVTETLPETVRKRLPEFDRTRKYTFYFLYRGMPDTKAVYVIRGRKYICASITVRVTTDGIDELKKGEFYRI